jgi:hypothetical protein
VKLEGHISHLDRCGPFLLANAIEKTILIFGMVFIPLPLFGPHNAIMEQMHSRYPNGVWVNPDTDLEQLKQDYDKCRGKGEKLCMMIKGYTWNNIFSFE